jgi:vitamin B12 transporter
MNVWSMSRCVAWTLVFIVSIGAGAGRAQGQGMGSLRGTVVDPLGAIVPGAAVTLLRDGQRVMAGTSDGQGQFALEGLSGGRYQIQVRATGFELKTTDPVFVGSGARVTLDIGLQIGSVQQDVSVTAAAAETPLTQLGTAVTVIDSSTLDALNTPDVLNALRLVPAATIIQTAGRGGITSLFLRGGNSDFTKVLIDGVPANDIGGSFDFAQLSTAGVDRVEVLRESNSVLYGSDALTGVVDITTRRGHAQTPEVSYSIDGGNLGTFSNALSAGGAVKRFDYFSGYSHFGTDNSTPNNAYTNGTYAGRFGVALGHGTDLSATVRRTDTTYGGPNGIDLYGIPDDATQTTRQTFVSATMRSQITDRWQSTIRFGSSDQTNSDVTPVPEGHQDAFGDYLGNAVTLTGANGYSVTGQAILDYGGTYPSVYYSRTTRRGLYAQTTYHVLEDLDISGGGRFEHEAAFSDPDTDPTATRDNGGAFVEARASIWHRVNFSGGVGYDYNAVFKSATTGRLSVASYLRDPSSTAAFGDMKLVFNIGNGIKAPSVYQAQNSLLVLLQGLPQGGQLASAHDISPVGPERSQTLDAGIEQGLWGGRARVRASYFHNSFSDLLDYVSNNVLPQLGVPSAVAAAVPFGAYVNADSYRAQGLELSAETTLGRIGGPTVRIRGSYTHLAAVVTKSFASDVLQPAINPMFPGIAIGQYDPLVGQQPFRRPPNSGNLMVSYMQGPAQLALSGYFAGKADDSTFLSDQFYGNTMLLPNHDLDAAYQKIDLSGSYRIHPRLRWYLTFENVLDEHYEPAFGFPALPLTVRTGLTVTVGGDGPSHP